MGLWADAVYHRIGRRLIRDATPFDLFTIYFGGSDVVGHRFWRYAHPHLYDLQPTDGEIDELGHLVGDDYTYLDGVLAEFIDAARADTVFIVMSDHGMVPVNRAGSFPPEGSPKDIKSGGAPRRPTRRVCRGWAEHQKLDEPEADRRPQSSGLQPPSARWWISPRHFWRCSAFP